MQSRWIYLAVNDEVTIALPLEEIHRVLHRDDKDFDGFSAVAASVAAALELPESASLPGVLVLLARGGCWRTGDATLEKFPKGALYHSIRSHLFAEGATWCRGVLCAGDEHAFVTDSSLMSACIGEGV